MKKEDVKVGARVVSKNGQKGTIIVPPSYEETGVEVCFDSDCFYSYVQASELELFAENQSKFKIGDKVIEKLSNKKATVVSLYSTHGVYAKFDGSDYVVYLAPNHLELIVEEKLIPVFKIGDRVFDKKYNKQATITDITNIAYSNRFQIKYDEWGYGDVWCGEEDLELTYDIKVGDKVKSKLSGKFGKVLVNSNYGLNYIQVEFDDHDIRSCCSHLLELVKDEAPKFKVGDKVKHSQYTKATDFVGEITDIKGNIFAVRWDGNEFQSSTYNNYYAHQLALAPTFRVGDRVKYIGGRLIYGPRGLVADRLSYGTRGSVVEVKINDIISVIWDDSNIPHFYLTNEIEKVKEVKHNKEQQFKVGDRVKIINCNLNWHGTVVGAEHNQISNFVLYLVNWDCKSSGQYHHAFDLEKIEGTQPTTKGKKMKVSQLMQDIVLAAEEKFGISDHINDCITISIGTPYDTEDTEDNNWGVSLSRPTKRQMDSGEVDNILTMNVIEKKYACRGSGSSLVAALLDLQEQVELAGCDDFGA